MISANLVTFFLSSALVLSLVYFKASTTIVLQFIAVLLILLLLLSKRMIFSQLKLYNKLFVYILPFLSSLFVQLLVISTGGFYSPFLILIHLYTLSASFLLKVTTAISFLILSLIVLIAATFLNPTLRMVFRQDPGSVILYVISFMVIIPLASYLTRTYHLKDSIMKILNENLELREKREQSILSGLTELVIVTDVTLKIISYNGAAEKYLRAPGDISGSQLLSAISLKDDSGVDATVDSLSINKVLENKITYLVEGFYLETKAGRVKVVVQIKPITNLAGIITQIAFVITDAKAAGTQDHSDLEIAKKRQAIIFDNLRKMAGSAHLTSIEMQAILLAKAEQDLMLVQELEDHPFKKVTSYQDLVEICQQVIAQKKELADLLKVQLQFILPKEEVAEAAYLDLRKSDLSLTLPPSDFSVPTDPGWLRVILEKLIDISIFLEFKQPNNPSVSISLKKLDKQTILVSIGPTGLQVSSEDKQEFFKEYYGTLSTRTNLNLASGLEGFIAKVVAGELGIPLEVETGNNLIFNLQLTRGVHV